MKIRVISIVTLLVAALLTACGSSSIATINTLSPSESATPATTPTTALCGPTNSSTSHFCITRAELALGQEPVHMSTVPDSLFIRAGVQLTIAPTQSTSGVSKSKAEALALQYAQRTVPTAQIDEAVLAQWHNLSGLPTSGQLTWVINVTPANGVPASEVPGGAGINGGVAIPKGSTSITVPRSPASSSPVHMIVTVDATSGQVTGALFQ
jgi:hypothetical protein